LAKGCAGTPIVNGNRDTQCAEGYAGVRCELCNTGLDYVMQVGGSCGKCDSHGVDLTTVAPFLILIFVLIWFVLSLVKSNDMARCIGWASHDDLKRRMRANFEKRAAKFRILVGFCQVASRVADCFTLSFPPQVLVFLESLVVFEFVDIFRFLVVPNCLFKISYYSRIMLVVCLPLGVALLAYAFSGYMWCKPKDKSKFKIAVAKSSFVTRVRAVRDSKSRWLFEVALLLAFTCLPSFCQTLYTYFDCKLYEDGKTYLVVDPSIECHDDTYKVVMGVFAAPLAVLAPLLIIGFYVLELWRWRGKLLPPVSRPEDLYEHTLAAIPSNALVAEMHEIHAAVREARKTQVAKDALAAIVAMQARYRGIQSRTRCTEDSITGFIVNMSEVAAKEEAKRAKSRRLSWREKRQRLQSTIEKNKVKIPRRLSYKVENAEERAMKKGDVGVSVVQVRAAFERQEQAKGRAHAIEWLQLLVRATYTDIRHLEFLFMAYRPEYFWFEAFELMRKFLLVGFPLLTQLASTTKTEALWGTCIMCGLLVYVSSLDPFIRRSNQRLTIPVYTQLVVTMVAGMGAAVADDDRDTQRFIGFVVVGTAAPLLAVLSFAVFDPEGDTVIARKGMEWINILIGKSKARSIKMLKPLVDSVLRDSRLQWADLEPLVLGTFSIEDVDHARADPVGFVEKLKRTAMTDDMHTALLPRLQDSLEPILGEYGLTWEDTLPLKARFETYGDVFELVEDPKRLLERMANAGDPSMNKKLIISKYKPVLQPQVEKQDLQWKEVVKVMYELSATKLRRSLDDPMGLLDFVSSASTLALGLRFGHNLRVVEVLPRCQANRRGVHPGDLLISVDGVTLTFDGVNRADTTVAVLLIAAKLTKKEIKLRFRTPEGGGKEVVFSLLALLDSSEREKEKASRPAKGSPPGPKPVNAGPDHSLSPRRIRASKDDLEAVAEASIPISIEDLDGRLTTASSEDERYPKSP
jgi:uncharacterized membrane protein YczE